MSSRKPDHPIDPMFVNRHSPRAFSARTMTEAEVLTILEAARWAPSASNLQPARFAYALRGTPEFDRIAAGLKAFNGVWAPKAAALVVIASRSATPDAGGNLQVNSAHAFDAGSAWMSLALQAEAMGWKTHAMGGFEAEIVSAATGLPEAHVIHAVIAIGEQGDPATLPESYRERETPNGRRPLTEIAAMGRFPV